MLVADDDASFATLMERYLTIAGYEVHVAPDGAEAVRFLTRAEPDVLLADIGMPYVDGLDLARVAREQYPSVQIVLMTAEPNVKSAATAVELGAFRYLTKPFERRDLLLAVERAAAERHKAEERQSALDLLRSVQSEQQKTEALRGTFDEVLTALYVAYQPIVRAASGEVFAYEALLRSTDLRLPSPPEVLDAAEALGAVHQLGRKIRERAAAPFRTMPSQIALFVNLHPDDLFDDQLFSPVAPLSMMADRVVLEIIERCAVGKADDLFSRLARLRKMGFRIAVDDLGSGYSAIGALPTLEPDIVKLDMSLVRDVHKHKTKSHIVRHLVEMAHDSGAQVVAEGVETEPEKRALCDLKCDFLQGYLIGRPSKELP